MQHADVVDLASERRISAHLTCASERAELVVMNGGARAEELTVETIVSGTRPRVRCARYSLDAGTSVQLTFPLLSHERMRDLVIAIGGGPGPIVLTPPARLRVADSARRGAGVVAAAALLIALAGEQVASGLPTYTAAVVPQADPATVAMRTAALPQVHGPLPGISYAPVAISRTSGLRTAVMRRHLATREPVPHIASLAVPSIVYGGAPVHVRVRTDAAKVRIVASIGPTIVDDRTLTSASGSFSFRPPASARSGRVLTIRAYAKRGARTRTASALVVLENS